MRTIITCLLLTGCGGSKPKPAEPPPPVAKEEKPAEPAPPPEPPKPTHFGAKAALTAVKGAKMGDGTVSFEQDEGADTKVVSEFAGLKNGTYHLVIHEGSECGPNGTKAGPPWKGGAAVKLMFKVGKNQPGNLNEEAVKLMIGGDAPIVGQTLVLHDDKKGAPGKMLACGTIDKVGE
jgi:Cu/Zn superoxide dismutase